jgi:hypothetical protein
MTPTYSMRIPAVGERVELGPIDFGGREFLPTGVGQVISIGRPANGDSELITVRIDGIDCVCMLSPWLTVHRWNGAAWCSWHEGKGVRVRLRDRVGFAARRLLVAGVSLLSRLRSAGALMW